MSTPLLEPRPSRPLAIRLTPLIDVVFILLVFFMLTTRLLPVGELEINSSLASDTPSQQTPSPEAIIKPGARLAWENGSYSVAELAAQLLERDQTDVRLIASPAARLSDFTKAFSGLSAHGLKPHWQRNERPEQP